MDGADGGRLSAKGLRLKGSQVCPIGFDDRQLKAMHDTVAHKQQYVLRTKDFNSDGVQLPAQLQPNIVGPQYESRLLDRLEVQAIDAPSLEYVRRTSTTGSPAIVAEGQPKPELKFVTDHVIATAQKIAAHTGISWESLTDFDSFQQYVRQELVRQVVDVENAELLSGDGTTGHLTDLLNTSGILTHAVGTDTPLDAVEIDIGALRTCPSLAEANLLVLHPNTFSALRRAKAAEGLGEGAADSGPLHEVTTSVARAAAAVDPNRASMLNIAATLHSVNRALRQFQQSHRVQVLEVPRGRVRPALRA